ncbi:hypothetical protein GOA58_05875 [Sinorhizobium meliloti]|uniref:hypothetical protein n=1 Tax=Rhizobium meliloti TaxID=382 RepID=UPI00299DCADB|nr:hypothetical protein [Sinorhizobium meliloti]MDW9660104.1 hypothetical protein [Sinorhizobium meliloti]MDX0049673.1 hypothetical protein [Sinorhizobium meliloti]
MLTGLTGTSEIDAVKAEIAALRERYRKELDALTAKLTALQEEALEREGLLDLEDDASGMQEHLKLMS